METTITNRRTLEQLAADTKSGKIIIQKAVVGKGAEQKPLYFLDKDGNSTGIQKRSVVNEAGQTLGWCSKKVCEDLDAGKNFKGKSIVVIDSEGKDDNGAVVSFHTLSYAGNLADRQTNVEDLF